MRELIFLRVLEIAVFTFSFFAVAYDSGTGTEEDPYQIRAAGQMNTIGTNANNWDQS
jgi:hypothetical protein